MTSYRNATDNPDCESPGGTVFIGNVSLNDFKEPDTGTPSPATALLAIDVISAPESRSWTFHFVTLELQIEAPANALFVNHSQRGNYHREVLADPSALISPDPTLSIGWKATIQRRPCGSAKMRQHCCQVPGTAALTMSASPDLSPTAKRSVSRPALQAVWCARPLVT